MTLVRVYCGLASADSSVLASDAQSWLTVSIVDDAGRLLDICEITDDPGGYAELCALFAQRGDGPASVAVATVSNDPVVTQLLTAAGRYVAYAGVGNADDFAERFADDGSPDEIRSGPAERRAIGLARALQAGVLSAVPQATPPEMISVKPLLTAHAAIVSGRQQAAGTLREVLRELYPAALRAYADPAEPVSLAVLQALPEPGHLVNASPGRVRESQVVASLVEAGVAEPEILDEAVTALRVAVAETPRRAGVTRAMTSAVAETVRQAVAAVRCLDSASDALVGVIADRMTPQVRHTEAPASPLNGRGTPPPLRVVTGAVGDPTRTGELPAVPMSGMSAPAAPVPGTSMPGSQMPASPMHNAPMHNAPMHSTPLPNTPMHSTPMPSMPVAPMPPAPLPVAPLPVAPSPMEQPAQPAARTVEPPAASLPPAGMIAVPAARPSQPMTPRDDPMQSTGELPIRVPGGRTAIPPSSRQSRPAYGTDPAATFGGRPSSFGGDPDATFVGLPAFGSDPTSTFGGQPTNGQPVQPVQPYQASPVQPPADSRNSRSNWPLVRDPAGSGSYPLIAGSGAADIPQPSGPVHTGDLRIPEQARPMEPAAESLGIELPRQREGRVKPPWQDDVPAEPPTLRLVEPAPLADPALTSDRLDDFNDLRFDPPTLRLVPSEPTDAASRHRSADALSDMPIETSAADDDLLIFAECRSAWFTDGTEVDEQLDWANAADFGWEAASQAAQPAVGAETGAGLPRRVPQQNLVPGSATVRVPEEVERPLRIVRDAASIAAHTSGYFSGYRRGQEVGGYPVGGRPGRESSVGWDFSRDPSGDEEYTSTSDYEYRSARR